MKVKSKITEEVVAENVSEPTTEETVEEKRKRRKIERHNRRDAKRLVSGNLPLSVGYSAKLFKTNWKLDTEFITSAFKYVPESKQPYLLATQQEQLQEYLLDDGDAESEKAKKEKFMARTLGLIGQTEVTRAANHDELKERFRKKMEQLSQKRNEEKQKRKLKKLAMSQASEASADPKAKKQFTSQSNPNVGSGNQPNKSGRKPTTEESLTPNAGKNQNFEKTPLRKRPVVKSDGQVVYSKFDFISDDKRETSINSKDRKGKPKPTGLLKRAENYESKIARLETEGKKNEAVVTVESRKWDTALKRADGEKIRDDPYLLKKTIKKQDKIKQTSTKKWKERIEHVEQQKKQRQDKRSSNIQARKDDNKKRSLKLQRKKGRVL